MLLNKAVLEHSSSNLPSFLLGGEIDLSGRATLTVSLFLPSLVKEIGDTVEYDESIDNSILDIRFYNTKSIDMWIAALQDVKQLMIQYEQSTN